MQLFFGFVGLFNIVVCWPVGLVLHLTGGEVFEWPEGGRMWGAILINVSVSGSHDLRSWFIVWVVGANCMELVDVNHAVQRLHLCSRDVKDDASGRDHRSLVRALFYPPLQSIPASLELTSD